MSPEWRNSMEKYVCLVEMFTNRFKHSRRAEKASPMSQDLEGLLKLRLQN